MLPSPRILSQLGFRQKQITKNCKLIRFAMRKLFTIICLLIVVATPFKCCLDKLNHKTEESTPCFSVIESKLFGVFECSASFNPPRFSYKGNEIEIMEAWVEKRSRLQYFLWWIPHRQATEGYRVCFRLKNGRQVFANSKAFWVINNSSESCVSINSNQLFFSNLFLIPNSVSMSLMSSWNERIGRDAIIVIHKDECRHVQEHDRL